MHPDWPLLLREKHCARAGPAHLPRETKAVQSHRKADTPLNSTTGDPRKPLKKPK